MPLVVEIEAKRRRWRGNEGMEGGEKVGQRGEMVHN